MNKNDIKNAADIAQLIKMPLHSMNMSLNTSLGFISLTGLSTALTYGDYECQNADLLNYESSLRGDTVEWYTTNKERRDILC